MFLTLDNIEAISDRFEKIKLPSDSITIEGNWGSFVEQSYINALKIQIEKHSKEIHIIFRNAKLSIIFMLLLKDILESCRVEYAYVYSDDSSIIDLSSFLLSNSYSLLINEIPINPKSNPISKIQNVSIPHHRTFFLKRFVDFLGKWGTDFYKSTLSFFNFLGTFLYFFTLSCFKPSNFRFGSLVFHIYEQGFKALPVCLVASFIVGYAITLQGAYQLNSLGFPIMSVDATAKLTLREMGPFILAIIIAGRSSSSFTAQLGSMRLTEELSAMRAMNLNIFDFLIIPRIIALVIVMPLMVFAADAISLLGGMMAIKFSLNIGFDMYLHRFYETVSSTHFWIGIVKAPFFGAIVGIVGCFHGLACRGDTQSIGRMTTLSVVNAVFWLIFANAIFSFLFTRFNL